MPDIELIQLLGQAQRMYPNWRLTQIIFNAVDTQGQARDGMDRPRDLFYITDETLKKGLLELTKQGR